MKKVLSFCVLSVLLSVLSLGLRAQSGLVLTPANLPDPLPLNQNDTIYLSPNSACFDALGLSDGDKISIEWQVLYNGSVIPSDSLSFYFEEFKFETRKNLGSAERWWGSSYTSHYCENGNGYGSFPGANTPTAGLENGQQCEDPGHFIVSLPGQNNPYQFDYFYVRWFKSAFTAHRLVYNIKVEGDYQFVFSLATRTGGDAWNTLVEDNDQNFRIGGHQSVLGEIVSSDTLRPSVIDTMDDQFTCVAQLPWCYGNVCFPVGTPEGVYDTVATINGAGSCGAAVDSIIYFTLTIQDPQTPTLDTLNSTLVVCDSGNVTFVVKPEGANQVVWYNSSNVALDTTTGSYTMFINTNTEIYVKSFSAEGCISSDSIRIFAEVKQSPKPQLTVAPNDSICENSALKISLDQKYDSWTWFHDGTNMSLDTIVYDVADVQSTDAGWYKVEVVDTTAHSRYFAAIDTIACSTADSVQITVFARPSVQWASIDDNTTITDSVTFCPTNLTHVFVATISGGKMPYDNITWTGTTGTAAYSVKKEMDTLTVTVPLTCDTVYTVGLNNAVDSNGCTLKDSVMFTFFINDTVAPKITHLRDTVSELAYANCEYIIPDLRSFVTITDACDSIRDTIQVPAAGAHVTTDTIVVITVHDLCGNEATDTIKVNLPIHTRPSAVWASFDGVTPVKDSMVFCPNNLEHYIVASVTGGTPSYDNVVWSGLTGTPTSNTNKSLDTLSFTLANTCGGAYTVVFKDIVDTNGCHLTDTISLTFFVNDTVAPVITATVDTVSSIAAYIYEGTNPNANQNNGTFNCEYVIPDLKGYVTVTDVCDSIRDTIQVPAAGTYVTTDTIVILTVYDLCGNKASDTIYAKLPVDQLVVDSVKVIRTVSCEGEADGEIRIVVKDGNPPYDVTITSTDVADSVYNQHGTIDQTAFNFTGLIKGKWNIVVKDTNGCQVNLPDTADVASPDALELVISDPKDLICFEVPQGSFKYELSKGTAPYNVVITLTGGNTPDTIRNKDYTQAALDSISGLHAGTYDVTVTDNNGCADTKTVTLTRPTKLHLVGDTILSHVLCYGDTIGNIAVTGVTGGTYPYYYKWVNATNDSICADSVTGPILRAGIYTVSVIDANGCPADTMLTDTIKQPNGALTLTVDTLINLTCFESEDGYFKFTVKEGTAPYHVKIVRTYNNTIDSVEMRLDPSVLDTAVEMLHQKAGTYAITVTDTNKCTDNQTLTLTEPDALELGGVVVVNHVKCFGDSLGNIAVTSVTGGTRPYVYKWKYADTDSIVSTDSVTGRILTVGAYKIFLTDDHNCPPSDTLSDTIRGPEKELTVLTLDVPVNDTCPHLGTYTFNAEVEGGRTDYTFQWTFNNTEVRNVDNKSVVKDTFIYNEQTISCDTTFDIVFTVTDDSSCTASKNVTFTISDTVKPVFAGRIDTSYVDVCRVKDLHDSLNLNTIAKLKAYGLTLYDNCTDTLDLVVTVKETEKGSCPDTVTRVYTLTDKCGNISDSLVQVIFVQDTTKPVFTSHPTSASCSCQVLPWDALNAFEANKAGAVASDNCKQLTVADIVMARDSVVQGCNAATWTYYYSFTVTDDCGNSTTEYATFSIIDTNAPKFTSRAPNIYQDCSVDDLETLRIRSRNAFVYEDKCASAVFVSDTLSNFIPDTACSKMGSYTYYITITDSCNVAMDSCTISIYDNTPPVPILNGQDRTPSVECDGKGNLDSLYAWIYGVEAMDACSGVDTILIQYRDINSLQYVDFDSTTFHPDANGHYIGAWDSVAPCRGFYHFKWILRDSCGNEQPLIEDFEIKDSKGPVFFNVPEDTTVQCGYDRALFLDWIARPQAYDTCSRLMCNVIIETPADSMFIAGCGNDAGLKTGTGQYEIYWTSYDVCGTRTRTERRIWTIVDTIAPQITTADHNNLLDDTLYYPSNYPWTAPQIDPWIAYMDNHNQSEDFIDYIINGDPITDVNNHDHVIHAGIQTIDECGDISYFYYNAPQNMPTSTSAIKCVDSVYVEYVFIDACENKDTLSQLVVIMDTTAPIVVDITDTKYLKGWSDGCGRETMDTLKTIRELLDGYYPNDSTGEKMERTIAAIIDDEAYLTLISDTVTAGTTTCDSIEVRTYRISDACGNDTVFTHTITYLDTIKPVISPEVLIDTIHQKAGECDQFTEIQDEQLLIDQNFMDKDWLVNRYAADNFTINSCHEFTITKESEDTTEGGVCPDMMIVKKFKVTKACGTREYASYFTVKLIVKDTVAPEVKVNTLRTDTVYMKSYEEQCAYTVPNVHFSTYADLVAWQQGTANTKVVEDCNVGDNSPVQMYDSLIVGEGCSFEIHYKYTVKDSCDNTSDTIRLVLTVMDTLAPVVLHDTATLIDTVYFTEHNCVFPNLENPMVYWTTPQQAIDHGIEMKDCNAKWSDENNMMRYNNNDTADLSCATFITVKYAVKDSCGNKWSDTIYQRIVVLDTLAPTCIITPANLKDTTIYTDDACAYELPTNIRFANYGEMKAWHGADVYQDCNLDDDCNVWISDSVKKAEDCDTLYTYSYTIADKCGNWSKDTVKLTVRVKDTLAPKIVVKTATIYDTMYYVIAGNDCNMPNIDDTLWRTPQAALNHGVEFTDCHPDWDNTVKINEVGTRTEERDRCTTIITIRYQVSDKCIDKWSDTIYQKVIILDTAAPVVSDFVKDTATYMVNDASDCWGPAVDYFTTVGQVKAYDPNFTVVDCNVGDDCVVELIASATDSSDVMCTRVVVRTYVVYDSCGNRASNYFTHKITVADTLAPVIDTVLTPQVVYMEDDCSFDYITYTNIRNGAAATTLPTYMQNRIKDCNLMDTLIVVSADTLSNVTTEHCGKVVYVVYEAMDSCNHATRFNDTIYVHDTIAPVVSGQLKRDTIYLTGCTYSIPTDKTYATVQDLPVGIFISDCNLKNELVVSEVDTAHGFCPMRIYRQYTVSDSCGKTATFNQYFDVIDNTAPEVGDNTLDTLSVYIKKDTTNGAYTLPDAYTTVAQLLAHHAEVTDCKLVEVIDSVHADTTINKAVCNGSFVIREYYVVDSCDNKSAAIYERINLIDTVRPWLNVVLPDTLKAERTANPCEFKIPDLHDTITEHFVDNWSGFKEEFFSQVPAPTHLITNYRDTVVTVVYGDTCGNKDTLQFVVVVPRELVVDSLSMTQPLCHGGYGTIYVGVKGGTPNYTYSYGNVLRDSITADTTVIFDSIVAHFYTVTVTDANGCTAHDTITVREPDEVVMTATTKYFDNCINGADTARFAIQMEGGITNYNVMALLLAEDKATVLDTLLVTDITTNPGNTDTVKLDNDSVGHYYIAFYGEDHNQCFKVDTSAMISVWPTYQFDQTGRVCSDKDYEWELVPGEVVTLTPADYPIGDSTYTFIEHRATVHGCDSNYVLTLRVEDIPFLTARELTNPTSMDLSNLAESLPASNFTTASTNVGWEVFVDNNCTECAANMKVSLEYQLYRFDEATQTYELMPHVQDYFQPSYVTYFDNSTLYPQESDNNVIQVPEVYEPVINAQAVRFDYFYLCWLSPDYTVNQVHSGGYTTFDDVPSGHIYDQGRANTIKIRSFGSTLATGEGDYKIVVLLKERRGGTNHTQRTLPPWLIPSVIGGDAAYDYRVLDTMELCFHVEASPNPVIHMPGTGTVGGSVVYTSTRGAEASANVYPNPARDVVQVEISGFEGQTSVMLATSEGKVLQTVNLDVVDSKATPIVRFETGDYAQGVYMVTIRNRETIITKRVILIR